AACAPTHVCGESSSPLVSGRRRYPSLAPTSFCLSGTRQARVHVLVSNRNSGAAPESCRYFPSLRWRRSSMMRPSFGVLLQAFFSEHLLMHKRASAHTIAAYRDTLRLL